MMQISLTKIEKFPIIISWLLPVMPKGVNLVKQASRRVLYYFPKKLLNICYMPTSY